MIDSYFPPIGGGRHRYIFPSDISDTDCVDAAGEVWPEHDYIEYECRRCGAETPEEQQ